MRFVKISAILSIVPDLSFVVIPTRPRKTERHLLRLHDQFCIVSLPYMDNVWSASERYLLSQHSEQANALATWTGRRLVREVLGWHLARLAFSACLQIRYDCTVILTVSVLSSVLEE